MIEAVILPATVIA